MAVQLGVNVWKLKTHRLIYNRNIFSTVIDTSWQIPPSRKLYKKPNNLWLERSIFRWNGMFDLFFSRLSSTFDTILCAGLSHIEAEITQVVGKQAHWWLQSYTPVFYKISLVLRLIQHNFWQGGVIKCSKFRINVSVNWVTITSGNGMFHLGSTLFSDLLFSIC